MNILKKVFHSLSFVVYVLVGIYALVFVSLLFNYKPLVILDNNMNPLYKKGSIIYYKNYNNEKLKIGDIVTYKDNNKLITNRIVNVNKNDNTYTVRGDNSNHSFDITKDEIIGINSNISIMLVGYIIAIINYNIIISIIIIVFIIVIDFILNNLEKKDNKKSKKKEIKKENKEKEIDEEII